MIIYEFRNVFGSTEICVGPMAHLVRALDFTVVLD